MIHHTKDPGVRASDIADNVAEVVWRQTGSWRKYFQAWTENYQQALLELVFQG